ncbi:hypothetical protein ACF1GT_04780 [Streptomyces sp. NPDC014636]|uniref:hypothetical protein n=1 Tax=Streptomyces sp. NPDC014636 TaxID=3364876 RepID=UPI00370348CB
MFAHGRKSTAAAALATTAPWWIARPPSGARTVEAVLTTVGGDRRDPGSAEGADTVLDAPIPD